MGAWGAVPQKVCQGVLRAAGSSVQGREGLSEMEWAGWAPWHCAPALELSWRRDWTRQLALGRQAFWEWRSGSVRGQGARGLILCGLFWMWVRGGGRPASFPGTAHGRLQASF